jgi:hypothetical protein
MCHSVPVACHDAGGAEDVSGERGAKVVGRHLGLERTRRLSPIGGYGPK